jgi:hypothetical protein
MRIQLRLAAIRGATALAVVISAIVGAMGPAAASGAPGVSISTSNGVLYDGCWQHSFAYAVTLPQGSTHWDLDVTLYGPDGLEVSSDYLYGYTDSPAPGNGSIQICDFEMAGTYTLKTQFEWSDQNDDDHATTLAPVPFTMRRPQTRTSLAASTANPRYGQVLTLRVTSRDERPTGYFANRYELVRVQHYVAGQWLTLRGGQLTTNYYGTTAMRYRFASRHAERLRAVTLTTEDYTRSTSATSILR